MKTQAVDVVSLKRRHEGEVISVFGTGPSLLGFDYDSIPAPRIGTWTSSYLFVPEYICQVDVVGLDYTYEAGWEGPVIVADDKYRRYLEAQPDKPIFSPLPVPMNELKTSVGSIHVALRAAVLMGAREIHLYGLDHYIVLKWGGRDWVQHCTDKIDPWRKRIERWEAGDKKVLESCGSSDLGEHYTFDLLKINAQTFKNMRALWRGPERIVNHSEHSIVDAFEKEGL